MYAINKTVLILLPVSVILFSPTGMIYFAIKTQNIAIILNLLYNEVGGDHMQDERKAITVRVSQELKFQIEKAANQDNRTVNSWIVNVIKQHLDSAKK